MIAEVWRHLNAIEELLRPPQPSKASLATREDAAIEFLRFDGTGDALLWIHRCECYFRTFRTPENRRVAYAVFHLLYGAQLWYHRLPTTAARSHGNNLCCSSPLDSNPGSPVNQSARRYLAGTRRLRWKTAAAASSPRAKSTTCYTRTAATTHQMAAPALAMITRMQPWVLHCAPPAAAARSGSRSTWTAPVWTTATS
jgi:hypothetical protein